MALSDMELGERQGERSHWSTRLSLFAWKRRFPHTTRCRAFVISLGLGHLTRGAFRAFWQKEYSNPYPCTYHPYLEPDQTQSDQYGSVLPNRDL
ncbi:hypothetical protein QQF64_022351 [Cirrhinus molitorella]|uniref:Uncharacterized protein n=1 Tax=Cirrhinus molitorella TaxID=172907 RepID=A0ABR3LBX6_9TELE